MSLVENPDLFAIARDTVQENPYRPLADRMRPCQLDQVAGQRHLLSPGKPLYDAIQQGHIHSMVFWGPPGTGKTTLARLIAHVTDAQFISLSAVLVGIKEIRQSVEQAKIWAQTQNKPTILFIDEVHRFNKAQQDAFLPHIEDGTISFIGATTENPSFELNNALLSRVRTYVLKRLEPADLVDILQQALNDSERGLKEKIEADEEVLNQIAAAADGDARTALNLLELAADLAEEKSGSKEIQIKTVQAIWGEGGRRFDKGGDYFYDQISALHKSVRGSSPDAALYWFCRMIDGGCDPGYISRRVVRMASEDIGNADPRALDICLNAAASYERLGSPEGELALAQAVIYLACAPKSNAVYMAYKQAMNTVKETGTLEVPLHIRNAPTKLMEELDHGKGYRYAHDENEAYAAGETYLPEELAGASFYHPLDQGLEIKIKQKLEHLKDLDKQTRSKENKR